MTNKEWVEIQSRLVSLEKYFMTVLQKAMALHQLGASLSDPIMSIHAKTTQQGVIGLLECMDDLREKTAMISGTVFIPVKSTDKPKLQLLKGGVGNDEKSL